MKGMLPGMETNPDLPPVHLQSEGDFPDYLVGGTLYRTGPGGFGDPNDKVRPTHFFDGFAQNHRFHIVGKSTVEYSCRSACHALRKLHHTGGHEISHVSTFAPLDPAQTYFQKFFTMLKMPFGHHSNTKTDEDIDPEMVNVGITIKRQDDKLIARTDVNVFQTLDPMTLEPLDKYTYSKFTGAELDGQLTSSHVEFSLDGKTEYNYVLKLGNHPEWTVFSKTDNHITELAKFHATGNYLHSFWTTPNYVILALWQAEYWGGGISVNLSKNLLDGISQEWNPGKETVFYVINKDPSKSHDYRTFTSPTFFAFHTINAFEQEDGSIMLDVCKYKDHKVMYNFTLDKLQNDMLGAQKDKAFVTRFKLEDGKATEVFCYNEDPLGNLELPTINPRFKHKPHRYVYGVSIQDKGQFLFESVIRLDTETGERIYFMDDNEHPGEAIFVPDPNADENDELAGVLLCVSLNQTTFTSSLLVLDPKTMTVQTRVDMDSKVNYGFHGDWSFH